MTYNPPGVAPCKPVPVPGGFAVNGSDDFSCTPGYWHNGLACSQCPRGTFTNVTSPQTFCWLCPGMCLPNSQMLVARCGDVTHNFLVFASCSWSIRQHHSTEQSTVRWSLQTRFRLPR